MDLNDEILKTIIFLDFVRKLGLVHAVCRYLCNIIHQMQQLKRRRVPHILTQSTIERQKVRDELMSRLKNSEKCYDVIRMSPQAFKVCMTFCGVMVIFKTHSMPRLKSKLASFFTCSHNQTTRTMSFFFCHSGETISRHFHNVLRSIIMLEDQFL